MSDFSRIQQPNIPYYFPNYHFPQDPYQYFPGYHNSPHRYGPGFVPASSRSNKRKRENDSDGETDEPLFPGEGKNFYKDLLTLSKNVAELQSELKDLRQTQIVPPGLYPQTYVSPYHIPYSQYHPQPDYLPQNHPPPAPAQVPPNPAQPAPPPRQEPAPPTESVPTTRQEQAHVIDASFNPEPISQLQKMFCDELMRK